ncbi:hypothetical protein [Marinomonas mediterranea]|uniref:hypothetical protein n=1 Tax=Marinomonas mediterranea TaxID=119864 RepID=UPI00234B03D1|nr:hypothetical protein [Marinomonas mediterranea]WCN09976.1 hypothetical protein GV055_14130 [Marinomonas mediterranea]
MEPDTQQIQAARNAQERKQNLDDYNNEMAGRDTGRMKRFGFEDKRKIEQKEKRKREKTLQDLLLNAEYLAAWNAATDAVNSAQRAVYDVLIKTRDDLTIAEKNHAELLSRAITLEDGRKVFLDDDGSIYGENGHKLQIEAPMHGHPHAPSWQDFKDSRDHLIKADQNYDDVAEKDSRLQEIYDALHDEHAGLSIEDLNALKDEAIGIEISVQPANSATLEVSAPESSVLEDAIPNITSAPNHFL